MQSLQRFMVTDLSNFYLDITKDRLYVRGADSHDRRACQTVLACLLQVTFLHSCHPSTHICLFLMENRQCVCQFALSSSHCCIMRHAVLCMSSCMLARSLARSLTHSFTHSLPRSLTCSFALHSLTRSLTHLLPHSLTPSLPRSLALPPIHPQIHPTH